MKALSIRQPWAWAIVHAGKRIENRDWRGCSYRGPILLHASKWWRDEDVIDDFRSFRREIPQSVKSLTLSELRAQTGGIVGRARIDGVIRTDADFAAYAADMHGGVQKNRVWWRGGFALVLTDVTPLPFIPCRGALGLFDVPDSFGVAL